MTKWDFTCSDPVDISVDNWGSGSIVVSGEATNSIIVEVVPSYRHADDGLLDQVRVAFEDGQLYVYGPRVTTFRRKHGLDLVIKAPAGSTCAAKTVSADLPASARSARSRCRPSAATSPQHRSATWRCGPRAATCCSTGLAGTVSVHTASGDVQATQVDGDVRINYRQRRRRHRSLRRPGRRAHR